MKANKYNIDLIGLKCPIPVLKISKKFKEVKKGDILAVQTDDPKAEKDIKELCNCIKIRILEKKKLPKKKMFFKLEKY